MIWLSGCRVRELVTSGLCLLWSVAVAVAVAVSACAGGEVGGEVGGEGTLIVREVVKRLPPMSSLTFCEPVDTGGARQVKTKPRHKRVVRVVRGNTRG